MPRKTHKDEGEIQECIHYQLILSLSRPMVEFLEVEAKRLTEKRKKRIAPTTIVRALLTSYYEKRVAGLLVSPDD